MIVISYLTIVDEVIFDGQLLKISNAKHGCKIVERYFQVSKTKVKYFRSMYSASVWNSRPLKEVNISNIEHIEIINDDEFNEKHKEVEMNLILKMKEDYYDSATYKNQEEIFKVDEDFHFGFEEKEVGITFMKVVFFIKNVLYK